MVSADGYVVAQSDWKWYSQIGILWNSFYFLSQLNSSSEGASSKKGYKIGHSADF
jgi:hypothetical protein